MKSFLDKIDQKVRLNFTKWDLGFLKTYGAIPGLILGAYFSVFIKKYLLLLCIVFFILMIRYCYLLFFKAVEVK